MPRFIAAIIVTAANHAQRTVGAPQESAVQAIESALLNAGHVNPEFARQQGLLDEARRTVTDLQLLNKDLAAESQRRVDALAQFEVANAGLKRDVEALRVELGRMAAGLTHDEMTLDKVRAAMVRAGIGGVSAESAITEMQNAGILFRERA